MKLRNIVVVDLPPPLWLAADFARKPAHAQLDERNRWEIIDPEGRLEGRPGLIHGMQGGTCREPMFKPMPLNIANL